MVRPSITTTSTSSAPTAIRTQTTPSSTTSYASNTTRGDVEIVIRNRAILLFMTDNEVVRRIHQVCCRLDDIAGSLRPA